MVRHTPGSQNLNFGRNGEIIWLRDGTKIVYDIQWQVEA